MPIALALDTAIAFLKRCRDYITDNLWRAIAFAALLWVAVLLVQINGLRFGHIKFWFVDFWVVNVEGYKPALADRDARIAQCVKAGQDALAKQIALNNQTKAKYEAAAKEADHEHEKALALANDRTERWIAANRVRQTGGSGADRSGAAAEGEAAGVPQEMPADAVMVGAADVRICTARSQDALSAYEFGQALIRAGVAE